MINSMTGFGESAKEVNGIVYTVEIKTVNNRFLKPIIRLPDIAGFLEGDIDKLIRENINRGTVNYSLRMKNIKEQALFEVDAVAVKMYLNKLSSVACTGDVKCTVDLAQLLALPGVIQSASPDSELAEQMKNVVTELSSEALEQLKKMRASEGLLLAEDLMDNCQQIKEKIDMISKRSPLVVKEYHEKLRQRTNDLLAEAQLKMDEELLTREVVLFADRSDIAEELTRLDSHLQQFEQCCNGNENAGRKLEFISQELLREANTIASKASNADISRWVIDIKCSIDRLKEQVQNVE